MHTHSVIVCHKLQCQRVWRNWIIIRLQIARHMYDKRFICCLFCFVICYCFPPHLQVETESQVRSGSKFTPCRIAVSLLLSTDTVTALLTPPLSENECWLPSYRQTEALRFRALTFRVNFYSCTSDLVRSSANPNRSNKWGNKILHWKYTILLILTVHRSLRTSTALSSYATIFRVCVWRSWPWTRGNNSFFSPPCRLIFLPCDGF